MKELTNRIKSFEDTPLEKHKELYSKNGFFLSKTNGIIKCIYCGIEITNNFYLDIDIKHLHERISPFCEINIHTLFDSVEKRLETFENKDTNFKYCKIKDLVDSGFVYINQGYDTVQCVGCKIKLGNWKEDDDPHLVHMQISPNCKYTNKIENKIENNSINEYSDLITCIICMVEKRNIVFFPCKHLICCDKCSCKIKNNTNDIKQCPVCNNSIIKMLKVYF